MLLGGLWHGANWTFVLWGFLHGLGLVVHRIWISRVGAGGALLGRTPRLALGLSTLFTFAFVAFCFTIFRCPNIQTAFRFFTGSTVHGQAATVSLDLWLLVVLLGVAHYVIAKKRTWLRDKVRAVPDVAFYPALGAATATLLYFTTLANEAFIYFQF
jgi:D-alanyl-lipoteichoic acid acyltransferase DltB (MBOAT superfamily)